MTTPMDDGGNFSGDPKAEPRVYASGSDEGFIMFDLRGNILKHVRRWPCTEPPAWGSIAPICPGCSI